MDGLIGMTGLCLDDTAGIGLGRMMVIGGSCVVSR